MAINELVGPAPRGWEYTTLGAACQRGGGDIQTGPFGSQLHASDYVPVGIPSIMPQNIGDNRIVEDGIARITSADADRLRRYLVRTGDIVYSRRGDVERRALVREREDGWLCGTGCLRVRLGERGPDPRFTTYYLGHPRVREWIVRHAHGATMPNLNTSILGACPLLVPPHYVQRAIAHILSALDDKIELNRRMSETLESMARALFKSWFVDFDPVRAKAEGRDPGLPKPLADLFPARLVDSELGEIPGGWEVKPIGDLAEIVGGSTPKTERTEYWEGGTHHWVTPKDLSGLAMPVLLDTERRLTDAGLAQIGSGLLPLGTVLLSSRAPIGYLAITEIPVAVNQGFIAMKPRPGTSNLFLLRWASAAHDEIVSHANGSTFLEISKSGFRPISVVAPTTAVMQAFDRLTRPMYLKVVEHERESRKLVAVRDALLPKLISGELRVKSVKRSFEVAA
ncbi:MAG: restriction endonuclease subunit S [Burkholderiales bacterium]|nr:restriction endonuclease subunit S [Burkholderiales bacterium]